MFNPSNDATIITPLFELPEEDQITHQHYRDVILHTLKKILPKECFERKASEEETSHYQKKVLGQIIPLIVSSGKQDFPGTLSFFALSKSRSNSFKFFFEMISRWLMPGRRLNVVLVYATDFCLAHFSEEIYTICEVMIRVNDQAEYLEIQRNFPIIQAEIVLGIQSSLYAQRILEIKGLTADDKTALIQEFIVLLSKRFPQYYGHDIFTEMQHVLVTCHDDFKAARRVRHLSRMIIIQYLFKKDLRSALKKNPRRRYLYLKIFRAFIYTDRVSKPILGILVGFNFLREQENFSEKNFIKAIQHYLPCAHIIKGSPFIHKLNSENICLAYVEIEKEDGSHFTSAEVRRLRRDLPTNLKNRIEHREHTIFMPRNEEEVMRNILVLMNQIKYVRDIPQVFISFDEQVYANLYFTVILARLLKSDSPSIADLFKNSNSMAEYLHDRTKVMGHVRKKYAKEATVFRLKLPKKTFCEQIIQ